MARSREECPSTVHILNTFLGERLQWEKQAASCSDLVLLIEGSEFAFKSCVHLRCIQCHVNKMTLDAPKQRLEGFDLRICQICKSSDFFDLIWDLDFLLQDFGFSPSDWICQIKSTWQSRNMKNYASLQKLFKISYIFADSPTSKER